MGSLSDLTESMKMVYALDIEIKKLKVEIDAFKKTEIKRLTFNMIENSLSGKQKIWLKKITSALFGETSYELEFYRNIKHKFSHQ